MDHLSFRLSDSFISPYADTPVPWGMKDANGTSVSELVFLRTYSRIKPDGSKERWHETCRRVIEGMYTIQKDWAKKNRLPWNDHKAQKSAQEAYDRMFLFKWTPPGRGLWAMGTERVHGERGSSLALNNCAMISTSGMTRNNPAEPFKRLMSFSMLGVGVGFDTEGAKKDFRVYAPRSSEQVWTVPDTREGWADSVEALLNAYLKPFKELPSFDYSEIRAKGEPIRTFGGIAPGPGPLIKMHRDLTSVLSNKQEGLLDSMDILDIANIIGVGVVSGGVRRSALLAKGELDDQDFIDSKDPERFPYRQGWAFMSNNSVEARVGDDLSGVFDGIQRNGEPGVLWTDVAHGYGRLVDPPRYDDTLTVSTNPCGEIFLEGDGELCCLSDVYLGRHESREDYLRTLKFAYLYAKTVTLVPTEDQATNAIIQRNRRIGVSLSGVADFADNHGLPALREWMDEGYRLTRRRDEVYSKWLGVRESIRLTTSKPGGTTGILCAQSPGVHWTPGGRHFRRGIILQKNDPILARLEQAGYTVEDSAQTPETSSFVQFAIRSDARRSDDEVSVFEKANLAATAQRYWADNSVSVTLSFDSKQEAPLVPTVLQVFEGQLKSVSFMPQGNDVYPQMPYQKLSAEEYAEHEGAALPVDLEPVYRGGALDGVGEAYCSTSSCELKEAQGQ